MKSDNFHDFFTEYVPYGEDCVLYFEERDFYRRFPNASRHLNRLHGPSREDGKPVTISSKSGLSWKVADVEESDADVSKKGPHMSSHDGLVNTEAAKPEQRNAAVQKAKDEKAKKSKKEAKPAENEEK